MKRSNTHRHFCQYSRRFVNVVGVLTLAVLVFGSGLARGGQLGQSTGSEQDKKKNDTTGTTPPTVVGPGSATGSTGSAATGSIGQTPSGVPTVPGSLGTQGGQVNPAGEQSGNGIVVVQQPGQQQQQTTTTQVPQLPIVPPSEVARILSKHKFTGVHDLPFFGYSDFESARMGVAARQASINNPHYMDSLSAILGPVGPTQLGLTGINMPSPERYELGPGDTITMRVSSPTQDPSTQDITVDPLGSVTVPQTGAKIVVRGQTLAQLEHTLKIAVRQGLRDADIQLQLKELRSMTVYIFGESFAPGTYQMPSVMSLFNAIYMTGGPNENGSLRRIQLKRTNGSVQEYDFYRLLIKGDRKQDVPLEPGDVITILHAGDRVAFEGEVTQPAIYELKRGEDLHDLITWSEGIKPSGITQKISIEKTSPGLERVLVDADAAINDKTNNPILRDGDDVNVYSIRPELVNEVTIEGPVDQPHHYGLTNGMTVADLISAARNLLPEAYLDRADLFRKNDDLTHTLIRIDLQKALARDPVANVKLKEDDRLVIYRLSDVQWMGDRKVEVKGAVNKPGTIYRADNLAVRDLLLQVGGLGPDAYSSMAFLQRTNPDGTVGQLFKINLRKAMLGQPADNIVLQDRDVLTVLNIREANFIADQTVSVKGAVQRAGSFPLSPHMTVRDLVLLAGNVVPTAHVDRAFIQRTNLDGTPGPLITFDIIKSLAGDPANNPELASKDIVLVFTQEQADFQPKQEVSILGAVQTPSSFVLSKGMKVHDLLVLAGKTLPTAFTDRAYLQRVNLDGTFGKLVAIDLTKALSGDPTNDIELQLGDRLNVYTKQETSFRPQQMVTISGAVQKPGQYPRAEGMTLQDLLRLAGGQTARASERLELAKSRVPDGTPIKRFTLLDMLGPQGATVMLDDGDTIAIPEDGTILEQPITIIIKGQVKNPGPYLVTSANEHLSTILKRAGGVLPDGYARGAQFSRRPEFLATDAQKSLGPRILEVLSKIQADEYKRDLARSEVDKLRALSEAQRQGQPSVTISGTGISPNSGAASGNTSGLTDKPAATPARPLLPTDLEPIGSINVDVANAIKHPGSSDDVVLHDGDQIYVPPIPISVSISGAVLAPSAVKWEPGASIAYYLRHSGGLTADADKEEVIVVRSSGSLIKASSNTRIEVGDTIFIPTKVEADRLHDKGADFSSQLAQITNAGLLIAIVHALIG